MFDSHELVYTRDTKTGKYSGGGYTLKSELLTGGAPPLIALSGGENNRRRNRRRHSESGSDSGSGNESDGIPKVSSIVAGKSSIVIPAGLFLIHGPNRADESAFTTNHAKIRSFLHNPDSDDALSDSGDSGDSGDDRIARKDDNVIPDDIYTALFKLLSPNDADKKRYWVGSAVTCRRRRQKPASASASASHKTTRKQKK